MIMLRRAVPSVAASGSCAWPLALALALALLLSACQDGGNGSVVPPAADAFDNDARPARAVRGEQVITGNATYLEKIMLPPGATLQVQLVDMKLVDIGSDAAVQAGQTDLERGRGNVSSGVMATTRLVNVHGPSIPFALPFDPADLQRGHHYAVRATLTDADGKLLFVTDAPVAVDPAVDAAIEFRMLHVSDRQSRAQVSHWQCGPVSVDTQFNQSDDTVSLSFSGRRLQLPIAMSGSGARYADKQGNEFWSKGDSASLTLLGNPLPDCTPVQRPSPWTAAAERGVGFRASGGEPGWLVEVDRGPSPQLRATLDYGEREIVVPRATPLDGDAFGFMGETRDNGIPVVLRIRRETCRHGMSGEVFEASARLSVGDQTYSGCGAFLSE